MRNIFLILIFTLGLISCGEKDKKQAKQAIDQSIKLLDIQKWFDAWELVNQEVLNLELHEPPVMVFFDDENVYSNSKFVVKDGIDIYGPKFFKKDLRWLTEKHNDTILLPTGERIPLGLMSFAGSFEQENSNNPFFVMSMPEIWKSNNIKSVELGDDNLYTSIFLHEFAHTQQMQNFGTKLDNLERINKLNNLNDDIIQKIFEKDSSYAIAIQREIETFYSALAAETQEDLILLTREGLDLYNQRQQKYFVEDYMLYKDLADFFLTMEGIGQYISLAWLSHPKGANIDKKTAIKGVRRDKSWWSQDEGFALFLIYCSIINPELDAEMFGKESKSIIQLLSNTLN